MLVSAEGQVYIGGGRVHRRYSSQVHHTPYALFQTYSHIYYINRNFLRGEVVSFNDFHFHGGDRLKVMMEGKLKAETKKYVVNDGDIIEFFWRGK